MIPFQYGTHFAGQVVQSVCQSDLTKVEYFIDNMFFDSDQMAEYLSARPSPVLFAFIKFRLGSHRLRVET